MFLAILEIFFFFLNSLQPDNRKIYIPYNLFAITLFSVAANVLKYYIFLDSILDIYYLEQPASVAQLDAPSDWRSGGHGFSPCRGRQHSFVEIDHEIFSTVILSLPLIQEGQLSVSG